MLTIPFNGFITMFYIESNPVGYLLLDVASSEIVAPADSCSWCCMMIVFVRAGVPVVVHGHSLLCPAPVMLPCTSASQHFLATNNAFKKQVFFRDIVSAGSEALNFSGKPS